jgi:HK97 family phage portal protein
MIAGNFSTLFAATSLDPLNPRDPAIVKMLGLGNRAKAGVKVDGETVLGLPAVVRGVNIISNAVMKVRPLIYRRLPDDDKERDKNHPSWRTVTRRANRLMSAGIFRKTLTAHAMLHGNGGGYIDRYTSMKIRELIPFVPGKWGMAIFRQGVQLPADASPQQGDTVRYWVNVGGEIRPLLPENVIHIKSLSHNGYWGVSVIDTLAEAFGSALASQEFTARFFGQGATATGIVFMPPGLKEEQQSNFAKAIKSGSEGIGTAHRLMLLEDGAKYQQLTVDPEKAQLLELRQFDRVEIALALGIQSHKLGDSSRVAYNSLEQSNQEHLDDDIDPWLQVWEDELEAKCLSEDEQENDTHLIEFNRKALVRVNLEARTARHLFERQNGLASANDILRQENQRPIGDVGDTYMVPANMTVLDKSGLPIIEGKLPQQSPDNRGAFDELAMHEIERLATRACEQAKAKANQGGKQFAEWLNLLARWPREPESIAALVGLAVMSIHADLDKFTMAPYTAADLPANVAVACDAIKAKAVQQAREQLEQI